MYTVHVRENLNTLYIRLHEKNNVYIRLFQIHNQQTKNNYMR